MAFRSILFREGDDATKGERREAPSYFRDLNLDHVVASVTDRWKDYDLAPFFHVPLTTVDAIVYRQEVMRDVDSTHVLGAIEIFSRGMRTMREYSAIADKRSYPREKQRWFLDSAAVYCDAVREFAAELTRFELVSRGFRALREDLDAYLRSGPFTRLAADTSRLLAELAAIKYGVFIDGDAITVSHYEGEPDYSQDVEQTFAKFRLSDARDYKVKFSKSGGINHIEAQILDRVAALFPEVFEALDAFSRAHADYVEKGIARFEQEVHVYVAYITHIDKLRRAGLHFCYPEVSEHSKEVNVRDTFDVALADRLVSEGTAVVTNDFSLQGSERILVVTGPNQGGKTTFARTFGQVHYLAALGLLVPGSDARLFLFDQIFSHFEREEDIRNLRGKLQDDLERIHAILERATPRSIVVMNEMFSSTSLSDAVYLSKKVMTRVSELDLLVVWVTFLIELSSFNGKVVSIVSSVDPRDPTTRTYKLQRRPPQGRAYALVLAEKYGVTYEKLRERLQP